jgi:hypothetical protein
MGRRPYHSAEDGVPGERCCSFRGVTLEWSPKGEATDSIAVVFALILYFRFSVQKSHVKPKNHPKTLQPAHNKPNKSCRQSAF